MINLPEVITHKNVAISEAIFSSNNPYEIPMLKEDMQAQMLVEPCLIWGEISRKKKTGGTYFFYTDDYRFEQLWKSPEDLLKTGCVNACEPNFSCYDTTPFAVVMYQIYRKRWLARLWQEAGVRVLVDLNVTVKYYEYNLIGVPRGWRAYVTRGYGEHLDDIRMEYEAACAWAGTRDILFVVYGGGKKIKALQEEFPFVHLIDRNVRIQQQTKQLKDLNLPLKLASNMKEFNPFILGEGKND